MNQSQQDNKKGNSLNDKQNQPLKNKNEGSEKKGTPRFNVYWLYALILLAFVAMQFLPKDTGSKKTWKDVREMILSNDVDRLVVVNDKEVRVFLTKEALENEKYKDAEKTQGMMSAKSPHYFFETNIDYFNSQLNLLKEQHKEVEKISVEFKDEPDY